MRTPGRARQDPVRLDLRGSLRAVARDREGAARAPRARSPATLYYDPFDPRVRRTRLLLTRIAEEGPMRVRERILDDHPEEADRFEVGTLEHGGAHGSAIVSRPSSARPRGRSTRRSTACARPRGEPSPRCAARARATCRAASDVGYAGLAAALATEGYDLRSVVVGHAWTEVPDATDVLLVISPRRRLRDAGARGHSPLPRPGRQPRRPARARRRQRHRGAAGGVRHLEPRRGGRRPRLGSTTTRPSPAWTSSPTTTGTTRSPAASTAIA